MGWIVLVWIIFLFVGSFLAYLAYHNLSNKKTVPGYIFIGLLVISLVIAIVSTIQLTNTGSFMRWKKSIESEFNGGITRQVKVISENGEIVYTATGKFDVDYSNGRLKWVDENGRVQIVYLGNSSTVVVNEIENDNQMSHGETK